MNQYVGHLVYAKCPGYCVWTSRWEKKDERTKPGRISAAGFLPDGAVSPKEKIHVSLLPPPLLHFPRHAGGRGSQLAVVLCLGNVSQV